MLYHSPALSKLNTEISKNFGIENFFNDIEDLETFFEYNLIQLTESDTKKDFGDFQTPQTLTDRICELLNKLNVDPSIIIEPTCGLGNFVISAMKFFPNLKQIVAYDLQEKYEWGFKLNMVQYLQKVNKKVKIYFKRVDIFKNDLDNDLKLFSDENKKNILIIGNPPWVTNTSLSKLNSTNYPKKYNLFRFKGLDAKTGKSNFDISENVILSVIRSAPINTKFAFLCKNKVVLTLIRYMGRLGINIRNNYFYRIDTKREFGVSASAGLFVFEKGSTFEQFCKTGSFYNLEDPFITMGMIDGHLVSNYSLYHKYSALDGISPLIWRQGIKHDAKRIMVLIRNEKHKLINKYGDLINIEPTLLFPLITGSQLKKSVINETDNFLIVTQKKIGQDTNYIRKEAPETWKYLIRYKNYLDNRKSSIYKNKPSFSLFGVGSYAFKKFKIAISGFTKVPLFVLLPPINSQPVMLDDTSYYLSFDKKIEALILWILLHSNSVKNFLTSIIFVENKRPFTKEILMRINLNKLVSETSYEECLSIAKTMRYSEFSTEISPQDYLNYQNNNFWNYKNNK